MTWSPDAQRGDSPEVPAPGAGRVPDRPRPGVAGRVAAVRARIAAAAAAAGRDPAEVTLVAVAKYQPVAAIRAALAAGVADIGENYAQDLKAKAAEVGPEYPGARWHMVGRVQRNKAAVLVATGALVHSLDSLGLARVLGRRAGAEGTVLEALVQVEVDQREAAHGVRPEALEGFVDACRQIDGLRLRGLMVLPAPDADPRVAFERVAELGRLVGPEMPHLSMGMSADLEQAVQAGATMVRIGTAIFGPRPGRADEKGR
jgi:pyridoxal phosphate enzyme (YggS family)